MTRLFVYGTLRPGYTNYDRFQLAFYARRRGVTVVRGARLFDLGPYPCMVLTPDVRRQVTGELLDVDAAAVVDGIRRMEEEAGYRTVSVGTAAGPAVTFVFDEPPAGAVEVASGDWASKRHPHPRPLSQRERGVDPRVMALSPAGREGWG